MNVAMNKDGHSLSLTCSSDRDHRIVTWAAGSVPMGLPWMDICSSHVLLKAQIGEVQQYSKHVVLKNVLVFSCTEPCSHSHQFHGNKNVYRVIK